MKASEFFKQRGQPAPSLPVKLRLVCDVDSTQEIRDATAVFRFVPDRIKTDADGDASKALATLQAKGIPLTDEIRAAHGQSHLLHAILRDASSPAEPFFDGPDEARAMLMPSERIRLLGAYQAWVEKEFPGEMSAAEFKEAMADAEGFTGRDLLTKYGYDTTRRLLIFLALNPGMSRTD